MPARKPKSEDEGPGAPEWMVTFSDCMTLLLTFFVLLLSFSSFDDNVFRKLKVLFAEDLPSLSLARLRDKDAFLAQHVIKHQQEIDQGSEKPTLSQGKEDHLLNETEPKDFHNRKVFLIASEKIFWGNGYVISMDGKAILRQLADFLSEVRGRMVVSEYSTRGSDNIGMGRSLELLDYLSEHPGLDKSEFSISDGGIVAPSTVRNTLGQNCARVTEIVLLERSIYN